MRLELLASTDARVQPIWCELERAARPAYFLTWGWVEHWLAALPADERPELAVIRDGAEVVAAWFLGRRRTLRHGVVPTNGAFLNTTGIARRDELCIEHNAVLARPGTRWSAARLIAMLPRDWDELYLPGVAAELVHGDRVPPGYRLRIDREARAPYVELDRVRAAGDYVSLLSANTRAQIRKARRHVGSCELEVADSLGRALDIYDELVELHAARWQARGDPGAFSDPWFERFHRTLIEQRFARGELQLLRLRAGSQTLGCSYNLVGYGRALYYQSGFAAFADNAIKPGFLLHAAAIEHCAAAGLDVYDLLAGDARYKTSLATASTPLAWVRVQRTLLRFAIEDRLAAWKHALARARAEHSLPGSDPCTPP